MGGDTRMAVTHGPEDRRQGRLWRQLRSRLSRYDLVLAAIPLVFALALVAHAVLPVALHLAVGAGALASGALVADVIYRHPPTNPSTDA